MEASPLPPSSELLPNKPLQQTIAPCSAWVYGLPRASTVAARCPLETPPHTRTRDPPSGNSINTVSMVFASPMFFWNIGTEIATGKADPRAIEHVTKILSDR